ncbi:MAG: hypothetical protein EOP08_10485, partial [Proteobacteria bacterium]
NGSAAQTFKVTSVGDGTYTIQNTNTGYLLSVEYGSLAAKAAIVVWSDQGIGTQRFQFASLGGGAYTVLVKGSGLALDVKGGSTANGAIIQQYTPNGALAQRWTLKGAKGTPDPSSGSGASAGGSTPTPTPPPPSGGGSTALVPDFKRAVIYGVNTEIFSQAGNFAGVTAALPRIKKLGANVLYVMPIHPQGQPTGGHPAFGSPYAAKDHNAINPKYGNATDFKALVTTAHGLGLRVILDVALNHTSWDNPLITQHPEYYVHTDGNLSNPNSIATAFNFNDVAQLDYTRQTGLQPYMLGMLKNWVSGYGVDGFRFDMADNPSGPNRRVPASFWSQVGSTLKSVKSDVLLLGEQQNPALAQAPFALDYGWYMRDMLGKAFGGASASGVVTAQKSQTSGYPAGMLHMNLLQTWDYDQPTKLFGGAAGAMAAATVNFTLNGTPLVYNGEEVANNNSSVNSHA